MGINQAMRASSGSENDKFGTIKTGFVFSKGLPLGGEGEEQKGEGYT